MFEIPIPDAVESAPALSPDEMRIAYTSQGELWVSSGRKARYTAETWAGRAGVAAPRAWSNVLTRS